VEDEIQRAQGGRATMPPKPNRKLWIRMWHWLRKRRNLVERFFNKLNYYKWIATRQDNLGACLLSIVKTGCTLPRLRHYN
jgi:hypothetical protein